MRARKHYGYYVTIFISLILLGGFFTITVAQGAKTGGEGETKDADKPQPELTISPADFVPVKENDDRLNVTHVNFDRRYAPTGIGEFLDIVFNVQNYTAQPIELYAFVMAYNETDATDPATRRIVPYPTWRVHDPDKDTFLTRYITITPADINENLVWNDQDPQFVRLKRRVQRMRESVAPREPIADVFPPYWKYIAWMNINPTQGLKFTLYGTDSPPEAESIQTNFIKPSAEQKRTRVFSNIEKHKYTLEHQRRMTIFRSHHYSKFRPNYMFFNMATIVLFDAKRADSFQQDIKGLVSERQGLQKQRREVEERREKAEKDGDETAMEQVLKDDQQLRDKEEAMQEKVRQITEKHKHLVYMKTFNLPRMRIH